LYHLDKPREFLRLLAKITRRALILQTHFSEGKDPPAWIRPRRLRRAITRIVPLRRTATTLIVFRAWWKTKGSQGAGSRSFGLSELIAIARIVAGRPGTTVNRFGSSGSI
jgi:hypothetical protein